LELALLCLRQASLAQTPAAASELHRMAEEYHARAAALRVHGAVESGLAANAGAPVQQQQQPQRGSDPGSAGCTIRSRTEDRQYWRERAEALRARAALLEDGNGRLIMLHMAEAYEALSRRAGRTGSATESED
jgi:hypothetical protein